MDGSAQRDFVFMLQRLKLVMCLDHAGVIGDSEELNVGEENTSARGSRRRADTERRVESVRFSCVV